MPVYWVVFHMLNSIWKCRRSEGRGAKASPQVAWMGYFSPDRVHVAMIFAIVIISKDILQYEYSMYKSYRH